MRLEEEILLAKKALLKHGVIAFPTETVMGLGVLYNDYEAYIKLNKVKRRPEDKPYTLMVKSTDDLYKYGQINETTKKIIEAFMPGSLTILVPVKENTVPSYVTHSTGIIGMRIPNNQEAISLLKEVDIPLLVPSANKSGEAPAINSEEVKAIFGQEIDFVVSGKAQKLAPSTILDCSKEEVKVVREGPIKLEDILKVIQKD